MDVMGFASNLGVVETGRFFGKLALLSTAGDWQAMACTGLKGVM